MHGWCVCWGGGVEPPKGCGGDSVQIDEWTSAVLLTVRGIPGTYFALDHLGWSLSWYDAPSATGPGQCTIVSTVSLLQRNGPTGAMVSLARLYLHLCPPKGRLTRGQTRLQVSAGLYVPLDLCHCSDLHLTPPPPPSPDHQRNPGTPQTSGHMVHVLWIHLKNSTERTRKSVLLTKATSSSLCSKSNTTRTSRLCELPKVPPPHHQKNQ